MKKYEPFEFTAFLLEKDKETLEKIFNVKLHAKEDILKQISFEEAVEKYEHWKEEFRKLATSKHSVNTPNKVY